MTNVKKCNLCGKLLDIFDEQQNFIIHNDKIGYGSASDGDSVHLQMCCECFDKLIQQCKVSPLCEGEY